MSYVIRKEKDVVALGLKVLNDIAEYKRVAKARQLEEAWNTYFIPCFDNLWGLLTKKNPTEKQVMRHYWDNYADAWFDPVSRYNRSRLEIENLIANLDAASETDMLLKVEDLNRIEMEVKY